MRDRKTLIYLNIKELTEEEIEKLADYDLNSCDKCGEIEQSCLLFWNDYDFFFPSSHQALCEDCFGIEKPKCYK